jgi:hypothetical protein
MNKLQISGNGFPGTNKTWRFLQAALGDAISGIAGVLGDKVILSGVVVTGDQVSSGVIIYNGELYPFEAGEVGADVSIVETVENADYKIDTNNDNLFDNLPAYITKVAKCGTGGIVTFPFAELVRLTRLQDVFDGNYNHLQNLPDLFSGDYNDLDNLPSLPQQATEQEAGIMPLASLDDILHGTNHTKAVTPHRMQQYFGKIGKGSYYFGDVVVDTFRDVYFSYALPTDNYMVLGSFKGGNGDLTLDNDVMWVTHNHTTSSFTLSVREVSNDNQSLVFHYLIIAL